MWSHLKRNVKSRGWSGRASRMFSNIRLPGLLDFERCENINLKNYTTAKWACMGRSGVGLH